MSRPVARDVRSLVSTMSAQQKALIVEGVASWRTNGIAELGIPSITLTDGPHGLRKVRDAAGGFAISDNEPATAFPPAVSVASSWNPDLAERMGIAIAREARAAGVQVVLGPGINIKRNPLCGRNFEYFSEDPLVSGVFGAAVVRGIESQGVASSVKHFAANSNENFRFVGDSVVDERALREIYLRAFERVVTTARPSTIMCAYNRVNGTFASESRELLTTILRDEWGFDGLVVTDWGATHDRVAGIAAGCDLDMPGEVEHNRQSILSALADGTLSAAALDRAVERVLALVEATTAESAEAAWIADEHAALSREIAAESAVLLHNDGMLPLSASDEVIVIGELFERMRFQGAGSSLVNPISTTTPREAFDARGIAYRFARGYESLRTDRVDELHAEAVALGSEGRTVLFFGGLTDLEESEGFDRTSMRLAENQTALIHDLLDAGARVVLVLFAGAPVELPFLDRLAGVLDMLLPGMHGGDATAALLFGEANPSGKLAESWPFTAADASSAADYNAGVDALYFESIYVGYRCYETARRAVRFPFGFGLSYTTFDYSDLEITERDGTVHVSLTVANTGDLDGAEAVQLYVANNVSAVFKAAKELRAFTKVFVRAGERVRVELSFPLDELAYWDTDAHAWLLENGRYEVQVGASARDIRVRSVLAVTTGRESRSPYSAAVDAAYALPPTAIPPAFAELAGRTIERSRPSGRLTLESRLIDANRSLLGRIFARAVIARVEREYEAALALPDSPERDARITNTYFIVKMMPFNSLRAMAMASAGAFPYRVALALDRLAHWRILQGLALLSGRASTVDVRNRMAAGEGQR